MAADPSPPATDVAGGPRLDLLDLHVEGLLRGWSVLGDLLDAEYFGFPGRGVLAVAEVVDRRPPERVLARLLRRRLVYAEYEIPLVLRLVAPDGRGGGDTGPTPPPPRLACPVLARLGVLGAAARGPVELLWSQLEPR